MGAEELKAEAISHLEEISDEGIAAMAKNESVAVILPTTAYILRLKPPRVREMIEKGVIVALGTDFNPNAFCLSMVRLYTYEIHSKWWQSSIFSGDGNTCLYDQIFVMENLLKQKYIRPRCILTFRTPGTASISRCVWSCNK